MMSAMSSSFNNTRIIRIDNDVYHIPADLVIMYINGTPFCHFREEQARYDLDVMDDYSLLVERLIAVPEECPDYLKSYLRSNFDKAL